MFVVAKSHTFQPLPQDQRPQDLLGDGSGWRFETAEHGGDYPDMMPQAIVATDLEGRSCVYVPVRVDGKVVDGVRYGVNRRMKHTAPVNVANRGC